MKILAIAMVVNAIALFSSNLAAQEVASPLDVHQPPAADPEKDVDLNGFGFGPALYMIRYQDSVIEDPRDVRLRGDGTLYADQTKSNVVLGVEAHYNFGIGYTKPDKSQWGWKASPYFGLFDVSDGINGLAAGIMLGVWHIDAKGENPKALNIGVGAITHKRRLVLADDVAVGAAPPPDLDVADYTRRRDIHGFAVTLSVSMGF